MNFQKQDTRLNNFFIWEWIKFHSHFSNYQIQTKMETIDCTPTWEGLLPLMLAVLDNRKAKEEAKENVRKEIQRMAQIADKYNELGDIFEGSFCTRSFRY